MKILLIGGTRFIGPKIINSLHKKAEVTVFNRGTNPNFVYPAGVRVVKGDRNSTDDVEKLKRQKYNTIIDTCAYTKKQIESIEDLITAVEHYIFISTAAVYDFGKTKLPVKESARLGPSKEFAPYAQRKIEAEKYLIKLAKTNRATVSILRPAYILGPQNPFYRENYFFDALGVDKEMIIPCTSTIQTSFADIDDVAELITRLVNKGHNSFLKGNMDIYNVAGEESVSFEQFAKLCGKTAGKTPKIGKAENPKDFPFPCVALLVNSDKMRRALGHDLTPLEKTLKKSWESYVNKKQTHS